MKAIFIKIAAETVAGARQYLGSCRGVGAYVQRSDHALCGHPQ